VHDEITEAARRWVDPDLCQTFWLAALEAKAQGRADYLEVGHQAAKDERNIGIVAQHNHIPDLDVLDAHEPYAEDPQAPDSAEQWNALERWRGQLSDCDRCILDRSMAGDTQQQIGEALGITQAAVSYRLLAQRTKLQRLLEFERLAQEFDQYGELLTEFQLQACRALIRTGSMKAAALGMGRSYTTVLYSVRQACSRLAPDVAQRLRLMVGHGTTTTNSRLQARR
jgi:predicted transcriptional regulator